MIKGIGELHFSNPGSSSSLYEIQEKNSEGPFEKTTIPDRRCQGHGFAGRAESTVPNGAGNARSFGERFVPFDIGRRNAGLWGSGHRAAHHWRNCRGNDPAA